MRAQPRDDPLDAGDVVVLRDDERAQRLPRILTQDAYSRRERGGLCENFVAGREIGTDRAVIPVQIEIRDPDPFKFVDPDILKQPALWLRGQAQVAIHRDTRPAAVGIGIPAEALTAVQNLRRLKFLRPGEQDPLRRFAAGNHKSSAFREVRNHIARSMASLELPQSPFLLR